MTFAREARPRLAQHVRLREDPLTGHCVLLYPEKGLLLNETAGAIARRCTGELTFASIIDELVVEFEADVHDVETEVFEFVESLCARGLVQVSE